MSRQSWQSSVSSETEPNKVARRHKMISSRTVYSKSVSVLAMLLPLSDIEPNGGRRADVDDNHRLLCSDCVRSTIMWPKKWSFSGT